MKTRSNSHIMAIIPHDGHGLRAPALLVDTTGFPDKKRYEMAKEEAKKRSGLAPHGWQFM